MEKALKEKKIEMDELDASLNEERVKLKVSPLLLLINLYYRCNLNSLRFKGTPSEKISAPK